MTTTQIQHIRESWEKIAKNPDLVFNFYKKLFEIAPETRKLFPDNIDRQAEKLSYILGIAVANLDDIASLTPTLENLGRRHRTYRVKDDYYALVKEALIDTIDRTLGKESDQAILDAWDTALTHIATVMINAPEEEEVRSI